MKKILSAILAVMLLVGILVVPSSASLPVVIDKESNAIDYKATVEQYLSSNNLFTTDEAKLAKMTLSFEKDGYQLWVDELTGEVATVDVRTGRTLFSNPIDIGSTNAAYANSTKYELMSQIVVKYMDQNDPKTFTSFEQAAMNGQIDVVNIRNGLRVEYTIGREDTKYLVPRLIEKQRFVDRILTPMLNNIMSEHDLTEENVLGPEAARDGFFVGRNLAYNTNADTDNGTGAIYINEDVRSNEKKSRVIATERPTETTAYIEKSAKMPEPSAFRSLLVFSIMREIAPTTAKDVSITTRLSCTIAPIPHRKPPQFRPTARTVKKMLRTTASLI